MSEQIEGLQKCPSCGRMTLQELCGGCQRQRMTRTPLQERHEKYGQPCSKPKNVGRKASVTKEMKRKLADDLELERKRLYWERRDNLAKMKTLFDRQRTIKDRVACVSQLIHELRK